MKVTDFVTQINETVDNGDLYLQSFIVYFVRFPGEICLHAKVLHVLL